jgi:hypothetical protein
MASLITTPDIASESHQNLLYIPKRAICQLEFSRGNPVAISYRIKEDIAEKINALNPAESFVLSGVNMNDNMHANDRYTNSGVFHFPKDHQPQSSLQEVINGSVNVIPHSDRLASIKFPPETRKYSAPQEYLDAIANLNVKDIK